MEFSKTIPIYSLIFFNPDGRINFKLIESLFSEPINYALITDNLKDMLRVAVSISKGKVTASTVIRRLGLHGIRNSLFHAFRELGRVVRTQFLLDYISNIELRETVQAATCKSETFNQFVQWVFFCHHGVIRENLRFAQEKMISFNHRVANLVILHNVDTMSKAIRKLKREGMDIPMKPCVVSHLIAMSTSIYWVNTPSISRTMSHGSTQN